MADNESAAVKAVNKHFRPSAETEELRGTGSGAVSQTHATAEKTARLKAARLERDAELASLKTEFEVPAPVAEAIEGGATAVRAYRESSGQSQHDVAVNAGMTEKRLADIEQGTPPHGLELAVLSDVMDVPVERLVDE